MLSKFHVDTPKRFQSLPTRAASSAVYLFLVALLHKIQLSLLYNILESRNTKDLTEHQIAINLENSLSYYCRVQGVLDLYLAAWEKKWVMTFHPEKCSAIRVTRSRKPVSSTCTLKGHNFDLEDFTRYPGVELQSN